MKVQRKSEIEAASQIAKEAQAHFDAYMKQLKTEHEMYLKSIHENVRVLSLRQNNSSEPKKLNNGVVVMAGDYYTADENVAVSAQELKNEYVEVK